LDLVCSAISKELFLLVGFAYVDDCDLIQSGQIELKQMTIPQGRQVVDVTTDDINKAKQDTNKAYKAVIFLECVDSGRYLPLW